MSDPYRGKLYPACFESAEGFIQWRALALRATQRCTPCEDCTLVYQQRMTCEGRCDQKLVRDRFGVLPYAARKREERRDAKS